jgi:hypothetical protein
MSVSASDIVEYLSASAGSTGGAITGSSVTSGVANNVNPNVTDAARAAGGTDYRKTFWKNTHATDAMQLPIVYVEVLPTNNTLSIGIGVNDSNDADSGQGNMTAFGAAAKVALISDGTDTRVATIFGLDNSGTPVPIIENVTLTGASEVLSVATFSKVWAVFLASTSGSRTVTVKQGTGGTTRGTIGISKLGCWLWVSNPGTVKTAGIALPNLAAGQSYGVWRRRVWTAGAGTVRPDSQTMTLEENA